MPHKNGFGKRSAFAVTVTLVAIGCATAGEQVNTAAGAGTQTAMRDAKAPSRDPSAPRTDARMPAATELDTGGQTPDAGDIADAGGTGLSAGEPFDPAAELAVGATCASINDVQDRRCGKCGNQQTLCTRQSDGSLKLAPYGPCRGESTSTKACFPNAQRLGPACGLCGKTLQNCDTGIKCEWSDISCEGEVPSGCEAGTVRYLGLGCTDDALQRQACEDTCTWGVPAACAARGADVLAIPGAPGPGMATKLEATLWGPARTALKVGACPATLGSASGNDHYTTLRNATAAAVNVSVWVSKSASGPLPSTVLTAYPGAVLPSTDAARMACSDAVVSGPTGLRGLSALKIAAGAEVTVRVSSLSPGSINAPFVLNAQLEATAEESISVPTAAGLTVQADYAVRVAGPAGLRAEYGTCPARVSTSNYYYTVVTVNNPEAAPVNVTVGALNPNSSSYFVMSAYAARPTNITLGACVGAATYNCAGPSPLVSLGPCVPGLSVPAGGAITVLVSNFNTSTTDKPFTFKVTRL